MSWNARRSSRLPGADRESTPLWIAAFRVEIAGGFVCQQYEWFASELPCNRNPLLLPTGQLGRGSLTVRLKDGTEKKIGAGEFYTDSSGHDAWVEGKSLCRLICSAPPYTSHMRKRLITPTAENVRTRGEGCLDVERAAVVEVTSEDKDFPVEAAFVFDDARGWRAASPGSQTVRLIFDQPQKLSCISLAFEENETTRTQEFILRWTSDGGNFLQEIVTVLELQIKPDIGGGLALASLKKLRLS